MILAYFYMHHMGWGWGILMMLGMVVFWALVIAGVVWWIRAPTTKETPRQVLDGRLARGELSVEEYERLRSAMDRALSTA